MITIKVEHNIDATIMRLRGVQKQATFATAAALSDVARLSAGAVQRKMPEQIDRPTPFSVRSIRWKRATKQTLTSEVYIAPIAAAYLAPLITGGVVKPRRRALLEPAGVRIDRFGNIPRGEVKRLLGRKDVFSGSVNGIAGLWQRTKPHGVRLLVAYEALQVKRKQFDFHGIVRDTVRREWPRAFRDRFAAAIASAR